MNKCRTHHFNLTLFQPFFIKMMLRLSSKVTKTEAAIRRTEEELVDRKRKLSRLREELYEQERKRFLPCEKVPRGISRRAARAYTDEVIRLSPLLNTDVWKFEALDDIKDAHCLAARCWFQKHPDRAKEFTGVYVCIFDSTVRTCNKCISKFEYGGLDYEANEARGGDRPSLPKVLENEYTVEYDEEPLDYMKSRAVLASEWRALPYDKCIVCKSDGTHVLVGQPTNVLCDAHFEKRNQHLELIRGGWAHHSPWTVQSSSGSAQAIEEKK